MAHILRTVLLLGALCPAALVAQKVVIQSDPAADFTKVRSYEWREHRVFEKYPELKDVYSTGIQLVRQATNETLMKRGFEPVESEPDVFITFFILTKDVQEVKTTDIGGWNSYYWYAAPTWSVTELVQYVRGMLVIDVVDARSLKLMWRAICGAEIKDARKRHEKIEAAVEKAFARFPPK